MRKIAPYWRLAFLPFVLLSLWTAHVCVTQFEPVRRAIVMGTVLAILLIVALVLMRQARGYTSPGSRSPTHELDAEAGRMARDLSRADH